MKVLFLGDIVGKPGRAAVRHFVPVLRERHGLDLLTGGNHTWSKREILPYLDQNGSRQLRPANYPDGAPGRGHAVIASPGGRKLGVVNLEGRVFMKPLDCPFRAAERLVAELRQETPCILVDMHCEATSEKNAMGHFLDGRVSAVLGTHTHVQTADERVLRAGTAYQTDVGMCGPWDSVIGLRKESAIERFLTARHTPFETAQGETVLQGAIVEIDDQTGRARSILRIRETLPE